MKNRVVFCFLLVVILCSINLHSQVRQALPSLQTNIANLLYEPFTEESQTWLSLAQNGTNYSIKVYSFDKIPYKGEIYLNVSQSPVGEVFYWPKSHLVQNSANLTATNRWTPLEGVSVDSGVISVVDIKQISLYIVNALTGDTAFTHHFPPPIVNSTTLSISKWTADDRALYQQYMGDVDVSSDTIVRDLPGGILSTNYSLSAGIYFAYFVNTVDGKLRWIEKVVVLQ